MNIRSLHVPITAAALAVLLTACGGGGGGGTEGKAVSASPNAPGSSSTAGSTGTAANGTSETLDGGTNANGNTVTPVAPTVPPTPQRPVAAFSDEGIRGDVLLAMIDQRAVPPFPEPPVTTAACWPIRIPPASWPGWSWIRSTTRTPPRHPIRPAR